MESAPSGGALSEAHVPTFESTSSAEARFPSSDEDGQRSQGDRGSTVERPKKALGLRLQEVSSDHPADPPGESSRSPTSRAFPKSARLLTRSDFRAARRPSARLETESFRLAFRPSPGTRARLGLAVGRKVGSAVVRNRIKRWVREVFRCASLPPVDVLVMAKPEASIRLRGRADVEAELGPAFERGAKRAMSKR